MMHSSRYVYTHCKNNKQLNNTTTEQHLTSITHGTTMPRHARKFLRAGKNRVKRLLKTKSEKATSKETPNGS